jgi:hypothetical protein
MPTQASGANRARLRFAFLAISGPQWTTLKSPVSYFWKSSCKVALSETCRDEPDWRSPPSDNAFFVRYAMPGRIRLLLRRAESFHQPDCAA